MDISDLLVNCVGVIVVQTNTISWWVSILSSSVEWVISRPTILLPSTLKTLDISISTGGCRDGFLIVRPVNGLCNRIRAMISCKILADKLRLPLFISWLPSDGFDDSKFEDLFELPEWVTLISGGSWYRLLKNKSVKILEDIDDGNINNEIKKVFHGWYANRIIITLSVDLRTVKDFSRDFPNYEQDYIKWFNTLKPSTHLNNRILNITSSLPDNCVGIHIRRGDAMNVGYKDLYLKTNDQYFDIKIKEIIESGRSIYLSTDSKYIWDYYSHTYPKCVYGLSEGVWRADNGSAYAKKPNQEEAVIDLWVLRSLKTFYGTSHSSFSFHANI